MLGLICDKLGVEFGEEWKNNVGDTYKITEEGLFYMFSDGDWEEVSNKGYKMLLKGELKPIWKPKLGSVCYMPKIINETDKDEMYMYFIWNDSDIEHRNLENGLVYKTKEEALQCAKIILDAIK